MKLSINKIRNKIWYKVVSVFRNTSIYPYFYRSYWNRLIFSNNVKNKTQDFYFSASPNLDAGIGHQIANWVAGYWWAKEFGLKFAHIPFSTHQWEDFLGMGRGEVKVKDLVKQGYKIVRLPLFDELKQNEIEQIKHIIKSYNSKRIVFMCEQDQGYMEQYGVMDAIQYKFHNAPSRKDDHLIYSKEYYNVAIHIRRGDIVIGQENLHPNLLMRWQSNSYFTNALSNVLKNFKSKKKIAIYLFSQGIEDNFNEFKHFSNLNYCLNMNAKESFLHMVYADLLITSKSSFSYNPALINKGVKVCPKNFWHGYPEKKDWVLADENGNFELKMIEENL